MERQIDDGRTSGIFSVRFFESLENGTRGKILSHARASERFVHKSRHRFHISKKWMMHVRVRHRIFFVTENVRVNVIPAVFSVSFARVESSNYFGMHLGRLCLSFPFSVIINARIRSTPCGFARSLEPQHEREKGKEKRQNDEDKAAA